MWQGEQRNQRSWWGNNTMRNWIVRLEDGSPITESVVQHAVNMFGEIYDTRKSRGIYRTDAVVNNNIMNQCRRALLENMTTATWNKPA